MAIVFNQPAVIDPYGGGALGKAFGDAFGQGFAEQSQRNREKEALEPILDEIAFTDDPKRESTLLMQVLSNPKVSRETKKDFISAVKALPRPQQDTVKIETWDKETGEPDPPQWVPRNKATQTIYELSQKNKRFKEPKRERQLMWSLMGRDEEGNPIAGRKQGNYPFWDWQTPEQREEIANNQGLTTKGGDIEEKTYQDVGETSKGYTVSFDPTEGRRYVDIDGDLKPYNKKEHGQVLSKALSQTVIYGSGKGKEGIPVKRSDLQAVLKYEKKAFSDPDSYELSEEEQKKYEANPKNYKVPPGTQLKRDVLDEINSFRDTAGMPPRKEKEIPYDETSYKTFFGVKIPGSEVTKKISGYEYQEAKGEEVIDDALARKFLKQAKGNKDLARKIAEKKGYKVPDGVFDTKVQPQKISKQLTGKPAGRYRVNGQKMAEDSGGKEKPKATPKNANHDQAVNYLKGAKDRNEAITRIKALKQQGWTREQLNQMATEAGY